MSAIHQLSAISARTALAAHSTISEQREQANIMSKFEYVDLADRFAARVRYVAAGDRHGASRPGLDALVIGDPEGTALVLEGTPDQLRAFVVKLAEQVALAGSGPEPIARVPISGRQEPDGYQHYTAADAEAEASGYDPDADEAERCDECGQMIPGGFGVSRAHLESCSMYGADEPGWTATGPTGQKG